MSEAILDSILETIGKTPLIRLNNVTKGLEATVLAKVEFFNPGGSVKDRIACSIIDAAEKDGSLRPGGTIVEATSGNTGAGLALVAALRGYKAVFTMPDKMSSEKIRVLKAYGAEVIIAPTAVPAESPESYYSVAKKLVKDRHNAILANQYFNPKNPEAHYETTGPEIWQQTGGRIDYFVAGMGTGGTISGVGKYLKEQNPKIKIIGADPVGSILKKYFYSKQMMEATPYKVEGVGEDIIPGTLNFDYIDDVIDVSDKQSFNMSRRMAREEGMLIGGSCGTATYAALKLAKTLDKNKVVVVLLPDSGARYLSTFFSDDWMQENRFLDLERISVAKILEQKSNQLPELIAVSSNTLIKEALGEMKRHNVSQLPVLDDNKSVGRLEEGEVMGQVIADNSLFDQPVARIMQKSLPMVSDTDSVENVKAYFSRGFGAVLVEQDATIQSIITKSDLMEFIAS